MKSLLFLFGLAAISAQAQPAFRAGVSAIDITPTTFPRIVAGGFIEAQSSTITDKLHTRSLVLDDGRTQIAIVIVDTCMMTRSLIDEAKALACKQTGIPTDRMLVSATHTHAAPAAMGCLGTRLDVDYAKFLVPKIAEGIVTAHKRLQPAKIGWGVVDDLEHTHTRRWIRKPDKMIADPFGELTARANMHPGHESPDVTGPSGPSDPGLSVISVQTAGGKPMAFFANYSMHYFGAKAISSDYYGAFARHIAQLLKQSSSEGPDFVAAMTQGTSGDQQWMDYSRPRPQITMDVYAEEVAKKAMEAYARIQHQKQAPIAMVEKLLTLNYRVPDEKRLAWARPLAAKIVNDIPKDKQEVYAREALILHERQKTEIKLQAIRIGDLAITTLPNEVYAITGLKLKAQSPLPTTINIGLANGGEGYIPPPEQHALGGYTTWPARTAGLEVQAEPKMVETLLDSLEEITGKSRQLITHTLGDYPQAVFASNPASYWRMDEIAGDSLYPVNDWRGEEPRYEPGVARYLEGPQGEVFSGKGINRAPHFAGGRVDGFAMTGSDYSVEFWFWNALPTDARAVTGYLFSRGPDGDKACPGDHLGIGGTHADATSGCLFVYNGNTAKGLLSGKTKLAFKQWHHVVLNRTGKHLQVFLDGKPEIEGDLDITHTAKDQWFIGGRSDNLFNFEGKIDEVAFYTDALTADETAAHYKASGMTPPAPAKLQTATPPLSPEESAKKWHVRSGYRIDLVAAEPVVLDPVAFDWDSKGRLWVIEMADYPLGMDGNGKAGGRVVMLEDTDADGRYDKRTVIVNDLSYPTGILTWRNGVIVTAAPDIFFIQPNGEKQILLTGFSTGNQQLRVNGLRWGMDGWVYCAAGAHNSGYNKTTQIESRLTGEKIDLGSRDFRFKPDTGEFDPQSGPSQFGRTRDDWSHWFGVQNSFPLWHYVLQDQYLRRNPHVIPPDPIHQLFPRNPPVYPASSMEKRFHSFDQAGRFTSACGIEVYRDRVLFDDGKTHAFTCEPFHNVVQHHILEDDGVTFKAVRDPAESKMDFLASEDRWCRPVMVRTGPDGALWVADMYRYMIEHPQWLPQNGKDELLPHYREGDDKGRIWRVTRTAQPSQDATAKQSLASSNGWQRDKAQMQLAWSGEKTAIESLLQSKQPQTRAQAAWTLLAMKKLTTSACLTLLADESPRVREQALQMAEKLAWKGDESSLQKALSQLLSDKDEKVRLQLACSVGEWHEPGMCAVLVELLQRDGSDPIMLGAILSSASEHLLEVTQNAPDSAFEPLVGMAIHAWHEAALTNLCDRMMIHNEFKDAYAPRLLMLHKFLVAAQSQGTTIRKMRERARTQQLATCLDELMNGHVNAAMTVPWDWKDAPLADVIAMGEIPVMVPGREKEGYAMLKNWLAYSRADLQQAAVTILGRHPNPETDDLILDKLPTATPMLKQLMLAALLSHEDGALRLLSELKNGKISPAGLMDASTQNRLLQHPSKSVKALAQEVFQGSEPSKRVDVLAKFKPALKLTGDAAKGKAVFAQVCISCHKLDGVGIDLGPDLRSVVQHDAEKLMNSILDPSAIIEPGFMAYHCTLKNGEQLYGVIATETSASLTLKMAGNLTKSVLRSEIASLKSTGASLMPEGLEAALTPQSLADLIAYLKTPK